MIDSLRNSALRRTTLIVVTVLWLIALAVTCPLAQAAPVFQAAGTAFDGTWNLSPTWPAHAINDVALLFVESMGEEAATLSAPAGFVQVANSPQNVNTGNNGTRLTVFWARASSTTMAAPTITDPGDHVIAQIITYRGVITTGDPWDVTGGGIEDVSDTSLTATGITTTVADTLIVVASAQGDDANDTARFSGWTNTNLTGIAERTDYARNNGNGGGFGVMDGVKTTAGATGNTTATLSNAFRKAFLTIALKPPVAGAASKLAFAQQPTNTAAGSAITPAITVQIQDAGGTLVASATDTVTIAFGTDPSGVATLSGTLSVAAVAGVATFSDLTIDTGGTGYTLAASATGLTGATSSTFNITTPSGTYGATDCAATRFGSDLVCTAQDVSITGIEIVPGEPTKCVGGSFITLNLDVKVNFATPDRWDVGLFLSNDGKSPEHLPAPASDGASSCTVAVLDTPTINPATAFLNLDPIGGADTCGDGNGAINDPANGDPGPKGSGTQRVSGVKVACQAVDLSGGRLYIPFLTSWDNQSSPSGSTCTSNLNPVPNTKSKCNVPNGTVLADVLKSTVNLVVLPEISKTDGIATVTAGDSTTYTVVITNTTRAPLSNAIFRDKAVANLTVNSLSCSAAGGATCPATSAIATMQGGGITLPPMPVDSSLTFSIGATVSAVAPAGPLTNTAEVIVDAEINSAADTNTIIKKLVVTKAFTPTSIVANGVSTLSITLQNSNLSAATEVTFTDNYPADLFNAAATPEMNSCGGSVPDPLPPNSLSLSGGTIPAGGSCTITVQVTSSVAGAYTNNTGTVTSAEGYTGDSASASLAVGVSNFSTSTKSLLDLNGGEPDPGDVIRYTITLNETAGVIATGISISDTFSSALTNLSLSSSCPSLATCGFSGQTFSATDITVPANGSVSVVIDGTIAGSTTAGTTINNCADISYPSGIGASPCASTIIVSPSAVAGAGNKRLYLYDATAAYKLSRVIPTSASSVTIAQSTNQTWALSPTLATPMTISPDVTPLAIIPVNLYLASNTANQNRTVRVDVTCSGGGTTYSESKIFDGTAVNNPYLPTGTPTLVSFNNLTISANHFCGAGQTWNLTVANIGTGSVIVHPVSGGNNSYISLPSLTIINVDSVNSYDAAYADVTTPASGYFGGGQDVFIRSVVSDPFGSFDITSATVTIKNPYGTTVVSDAAMSVVADSVSATKTFERQYTIPTSGPAGIWTTIVTAQEGTEGTISDDGTGVFKLGLPSLLVLKSAQTYSDPINGTSSPKAIPGAFVTYTILVTNTGYGTANATVITDPIPADTELFVGDINGAGSGPILFSNGATASGLSYTFTSLASTTDNLEFSGNSGADYDKSNTTPDSNECDPTVTNIRIPLNGTFNASDGTNHPTFNVKFRVRIK